MNEGGWSEWSETWHFRVAVGTAVESEPGIPTSYALHANYPNPFNPTTTITYDLPEATDVRLTVYDALGRTVETIGTWHLAPGTYEATWEPSGLPSGVYLYRLETPAFSRSRRMMLLK
jgi:hypothetical protein